MDKYDSELLEKAIKNCSDEYKRKRAEALKNRRYYKFTAMPGSFIIRDPKESEKESESE